MVENMFSVSSLEPGGARVVINPEVSTDRQILKFTASLNPGTNVEVRFLGKHVAGSPYTYRMKLLQDMDREIAEAENRVFGLGLGLGPANKEEVEKKASVANKAETKEAASATAKPSTPLSSASSIPGIDFSKVTWREGGFIHKRNLGQEQPLGLCLLKNGHLVVSTMDDHVKMFDPQLEFHKEILGENGQKLTRPYDMALLYNGDFVLKVFNISCIHAETQ